MIVSEHDVQTALEYLSQDPHPVAIARKDITDASNSAKAAYARGLLAAEGPVEIRKAQAQINALYLATLKVESAAVFTLENELAKDRSAKMLLEIWRTESANIRAAESIR